MPGTTELTSGPSWPAWSSRAGWRAAHRSCHRSGRQLLRWTAERSPRDTHVAVRLLVVLLRLTTAAAGSSSTAATGLLVLGHPVVIAPGAASPHAKGDEHPDENNYRDESEDNDQTPHSTTQRHGLAVDADAETCSVITGVRVPKDLDRLLPTAMTLVTRFADIYSHTTCRK